jgi:PAS domain S-box-containing protein
MGNESSNKEQTQNITDLMSDSFDRTPETINELDYLAHAISNWKNTQIALKESEEKYRLLFSNVPMGILHFNHDGKITTCNDNFLSMIDFGREEVMGQEIIDVIDIHLASAIENALSGKGGHYEGDLVSKTSGKITPVRVNFAPIILESGFVSGGVGIFEDITERKQIEKIFFHDILNTAGNLMNFAELLTDEEYKVDNQKAMIAILGQLAQRIVDEINTHRHLLTSQKDIINLNIKKIYSLDFIQKIINSYSQADFFEERSLKISEDSVNIEFESDETILGRVLNNMIKNALEASAQGEAVILKCCSENNMICFSAHNSKWIPKDIQTQLLKRTISTKGSGRGLGIYSMKFLTEKYLNGTIGFTSTKKEGTTFTVCYPLIVTKSNDII